MNINKIGSNKVNKKVIWFFGVNGVGKTSLIKEILERTNRTRIQAFFQTLMDVTGVLSRFELENMRAVVKYDLLEKALLKKFNAIKSTTEYVLIDSHLMVPIRNMGLVHYECMWSNRFINFSNRAYMLIADPYEILKRRVMNEKLSGRKRDLNLENVNQDQETNKIMLDSLLKPILPTVILETTKPSIKKIADHIINTI